MLRFALPRGKVHRQVHNVEEATAKCRKTSPYGFRVPTEHPRRFGFRDSGGAQASPPHAAAIIPALHVHTIAAPLGAQLRMPYTIDRCTGGAHPVVG